MQVRTPKGTKALQATTSLHYPNETTETGDESGQGVENHYSPDTLTDPEDNTGGDLHFRNEEKKPPTKNPRVTAKAAPAKAKRVQAAPSVLDEPMDDEDGNITTADFDDGVDVDLDTDEIDACDDGGTTGEAGGQQNLGTIDNDVDPAAGYLPMNTEMTASDFDVDEIDASDVDMPEGNAPQQMLEADADGWDEGDMSMPVDEQSEADQDAEMNPDAPLLDEDLAGDDMIDDDVDQGMEVPTEAGDAMDLLDVDGVPETETDGVAFATTAANRVLVIRGTRIIATMSRRLAASQDKSDVYLTDQFQTVTAAEIKRKGLRKGLKTMGFALEKINVARADVLNKRVQAKVATAISASRHVEHQRQDAMDQCMAIAAVGINRSYFKDTPNELRAALEAELQAAGVRNPGRLVRRVFASKGIDYARQIVTLAQKLSAMPEVARNAHADALDIVSDDADDSMEGEDTFGTPGSKDFQVQSNDDGFGGDDEGFDEGEDLPSTVEAALMQPSRPARTQISASAKVRTSLTASAVLSGEAKLPFAMF